MHDYQFWTLVGLVSANTIALFAFLWKISSDNRKSDAARHKEMEVLRKDMHQMEIRLSKDIRDVDERVAGIAGRLDERQSMRRHKEETLSA